MVEMNFTHSLLQDEIAFYENQLNQCDNINMTDASDDLEKRKEEIMKHIKEDKEKYVLSRPETRLNAREIKRRNGTIKIEYETYYDGDRHRFASYDHLIENAYVFYTNSENTDKPTVRKYSFEYVHKKAVEERAELKAAASSTVERWQRTYKRYVDQTMAKQDIRKFTSKSLQRYILHEIKEKKLKKHEFEGLKGMLNIVFNYAVDHGIIKRNPVPEDDDPALKLVQPDDRRPEAKAFSKEDVHKIQEHEWYKLLNGKSDVERRNAAAILLSSYTGLRVGEICALKWQDVEFGKKRLRVHAQITFWSENHKTVFEYTNSTKNEKRKSRGGRYVPMIDDLIKVLEIMRTITGSSEWVFSQDGSFLKPNAYERALRRCAKTLHLNLFNNHALRMSFNSYYLIERGFSVADRARILGHSILVNQNNYTYGTPDDCLDELRIKLNQKLE